MSKTDGLLTATELELMCLLWKAPESTVRQLMDALPSDRQLAYTSVSTIVRILEKKGFVSSKKEGKTHIYSPLIKKDEYEGRTLTSLVDGLFEGTPLSLVKSLIDSDKLSPNDLKELKSLLDKGE